MPAMMHNTDDRDAIRLLGVIAQAYPDAVDLTVESWVLGLSDERMNVALATLERNGCVQLAGGGPQPFSRQARVTAKGLSLAQALHAMPVPGAERRHVPNDRRRDSEPVPPPGVDDRRRSRRDRRSPAPFR